MAVTVADWLLAMVPAVAVNVAVVAPAVTVFDDGTVSKALLLDKETEVPPLGAAWFSVIVHVEVPAELTLVGLQARLLTATGGFTVMLPPVPVRVRAFPLPEAAAVLVTEIGTVPDALAASVTFTVAACPF